MFYSATNIGLKHDAANRVPSWHGNNTTVACMPKTITPKYEAGPCYVRQSNTKFIEITKNITPDVSFI